MNSLPIKLELGLTFLSDIKEIFPEATYYIAGGAVRDAFCGKSINDIDIYTDLPLHNPNTINKYLKAIKNLPHVMSAKLNSRTNQYSNYNILNIELFNMVSIDKTNIELIFSEDTKPLDVIHNFDIGLCMIYITDELKLVKTEKFNIDYENKLLTLYPNTLSGNQICRSIMYHIPKIRKKYTDHKLVIDYE